MPEGRTVLPSGDEGVLQRAGPDVGVGELVKRQPVKLQVVFLADRLCGVDGHLEDEVDFVVGHAVLDVAVFDSPDEARDLGVGAEFFGEFAHEGDFHPLTRFDVAAGQKRPGLGALTHQEKLTVAADDGPGDDLGGRGAHACLSCRSLPLGLRIVAISELTVEDVAAGVAEVLPEAAPVRPVRALRRGRSHVSWVLESPRGRLVGKVLLGCPRDGFMERLAEHRRVWEHGVLVPPVLAFTDSCPAVGGQPLTVFEYLPGVDAEETLPSVDADRALALMRDTGAALARLHQVPVGGFGDAVGGLGVGPASWGAVVAGRAAWLRDAYRSLDEAPLALVEAGIGLLCRLADDVSPHVRPAVAHLDVYLPNILVDDKGRFRILLDLEHVRWVDPVMDFVKPAMWMFAERPAWADAFADGYRSAGTWPERWSERLSVATGLELLTGVQYWIRVADHEMREDYLRRLRAWVRSDGAAHVWASIRP